MNRLVKRNYDADGAGSGAATNQYWVYDEGINAVLQFDGSAASNLAHRYLWSNQVDELLADEQVTSLGAGSNTLWGLGDHLGTLRDIADFNESTSVTSVTNHRTYNAFGKLTAETNSAVDILFGYTGKQLDEATGLQHNLFRWYDSSIGQWMNEDPLGFSAGDENIRRYVGNKSISAKDPSGLAEPSAWDDYFRYFTNPSDMDDGLEMGFYASMGLGVGAGVGAVGLSVAGAYGVSAIGSMTMQEITFSTMLIANSPVYGVSATGVGYAVVEGLTGYPGSLSPDDAIRGVASFADDAARIVENTITSRGLSRMCNIINMTRKADIKAIDEIVKSLGMTKPQRRLLHDDITGMNYTLEEILEMAKLIKEIYPNK